MNRRVNSRGRPHAWILFAFVAGAWFAARDVWAADCGPGGEGPVVHVETDLVDPVLSRAVLDEIAAAVARDGFRVCEVDSGTEPVAVLRFRAVGEHREIVEMDIHAEDRMTGKDLSRRLDLRNFTGDSRALAVAVAGTELLRASWLELALPETKPAEMPPAEVRRVVETDVERGGARRRTLGVLPAFEIYDEGERLWGGDLFFGYWFGDYLGIEAALGARRGLAQSFAHGEVQTTALAAWTGLLVRLLHRGRWSWIGSATVAGAAVRMEGLAAPGAIGDTDVGYALIGRAGTGLLIETGPRLVWRLGAGVGMPILGVGAEDQGQRVTGVVGLELYARVGAGIRF